MNLIRQFDLVKGEMGTPVTVIGAGGIGSFTVITLAKMGFTNITVFDDDIVSPENLPNQFYREQDIGMSKVAALEDIVQQFTSTQLMTHARRATEHDVAGARRGIVISAVDNMDTRRMIWNAWQADVFLDGRMGGDQAEVYAVRRTDIAAREQYVKTLWREEDAWHVPCTSKATMYNCLTIASLLSNLCRHAIAPSCPRLEHRMVVDNFNFELIKVRT